ncbi:SGNH/GDSL hydrolase family protein [Fictibacillus fluitans]|uniref:GDSL-type esterase/lipase family protein n=1 Tax=Fictibacillus fluitans TaxID=3058422 RepID=A0ABT8HZ23_9BACL|nr:GDSL-type esterase/lipase family protein [Fictibacillus sp. NE201]MDN4526023.1 GDSL-type esterase/lipase family protein [Fictibacillus sp. NE201]
MKKSFAGLMAAGMLFVSVPFTASASGGEKHPEKVVEYVALGDSIAAGMTPYGEIGKSYPDFIKNYFEKGNYTLLDYDNFGVPGYTSLQLKTALQMNVRTIKEVKEATHITINIGANDLFRKLLSDPSRASEGIAEARDNLQASLQQIDRLNPGAHVYVMGYYNPFSYYSEEAQAFLVPLNDALNTVIETAARENGDTYVPTGPAIDPHFEKYMPNPEDNHLNVKGYKVIAKAFWKAIKEDRK